MILKILISFILGFFIGHNIEKIIRYLFLKFMKLKFKESKYKGLFDSSDIDNDFWNN